MSANDTEAYIGEDDSVVRVLNFSSGGYDAVMQLGVVHALLVIQGRAPDAIVGISAGAVNAVAAAEILQAGEAEEKRLIDEAEKEQRREAQQQSSQAELDRWPEETAARKTNRILGSKHESRRERWRHLRPDKRCKIQERRIEARTARFRDVLRAYERAPYEISSAIVPDAYQVDTNQPLEPQRLPIHDVKERDFRKKASNSKHGLISLYNQLLRVRLSVSSYTRMTRRILGLAATREITNTPARRLALAMEIARMWWLLRANMFRVASLGQIPFRTIRSGRSRAKGAPAGALISRSRFWSGLVSFLWNVITFSVLAILWVGVTAIIVGLPFVIVGAVLGWAHLLSKATALIPWAVISDLLFVGAGFISAHWLAIGLILYAVFFAYVIVRRRGKKTREAWAEFVRFNHLSTKGIIWVGVTAIIVGLPFVIVGAVLGWAHLLSKATALIPWAVISDLFFVGAGFVSAHWLAIGLILYAVFFAYVIVRGRGKKTREAWAEFVRFNHLSTKGIIAELASGLAGVVVLFAWSLLVALIAVAGIRVAPAVVDGAWSTFHAILSSESLPSTAWLDPNGFPGALKDAWPITWRAFAYPFIVLTLAVIALWRVLTPRATRVWKDAPRRLLASYDLDASIFGPHAIRQLFVRLFDPAYYGEREIDEIVDDAMEGRRPNSKSESFEPSNAKRISGYADPDHGNPVHVGLAVADVRSGKLDVVPQDAPVVDGLLAATAVTPLFPMQQIGDRWFLDGATISGASIQPALSLLREKDIAAAAKYVHLFSVSSLPFSKPELQASVSKEEVDSVGLPLNLVETVARANALQRYRDATLERTLTDLYWRTLPPTKAQHRVGERKHLRVCVTPIEPEFPLGLNARVMAAESRAKRHQLIREAVADGCRAALQVMIGASQDPREQGTETPCRRAVVRHIETRISKGDGGLSGLADVACAGTLDANPECGPGISEVCEECAIRRGPDPTERECVERLLSFSHSPDDRLLPWPHEREIAPDREVEEPSRSGISRPRDGPGSVAQDVGWPASRGDLPPNGRPLVNLLFSGGVFRGVFQLGVLNALSEVGLKPDLLAGASVGSITAAMAAETFAVGGAAGPEGELHARRKMIARLASAYLTIDQIVLTDRFSDLIRTATVRAGSTRFSLQQSDRFFRRYDTARSAQFMRDARAVVAGIERLFYVSPFELLDLVRAFRENRPDTVFRFFKKHVQEWLDRMGVGVEVLGAEPLELLIERYVTNGIRSRRGWYPDSQVPFDAYRADGMCLLATATDVTGGSLQVLGMDQLRTVPDRTPLERRESRQPELSEGLLASSAFPGVFRPRASSELEPRSADRHYYIDGGVMDNLPLHAVTEFLCQAAHDEVVKRRPEIELRSLGSPERKVPAPHLVLATSLKVDPPADDSLTDLDLKALSSNWPALWQRARQLSYNRKLKNYAETQSELRDILSRHNADWKPVDLEFVTIQPKWLCGTFAFHPMLGFRRTKQAASIAHGCYSTFHALDGLVNRLSSPEKKACMDCWGLQEVGLRELASADAGSDNGNGRCWHRDAECPFARSSLDQLGLPDATVEQLEKIHDACKQPETHGRQDGAFA